MGWIHDYDVIVTGKNVGNSHSVITGIQLVSVTSSKIVANVTYTDNYTVNGKAATEVYTDPNVYEVINGRWFLTSMK
jgi:hypothetical protein